MHAAFQYHVTFSELALGFVFVLLRILAAADTTEIEQLLAFAVRDALAAAHISVKDAAYHMQTDYTQLTRQLRAEPQQFLSLTRLIRLPFGFWVVFTPVLVSLVYRKRMSEMKESFSDMKRPV